MPDLPLTGEFNALAFRRHFPLLHGNDLIYLDSAATKQKPAEVIEAVEKFYSTYNANVHRGIYKLADEATDAYENSRDTVRAFINARSSREIIFTRGSTESINLVAQSYVAARLQNGTNIVISEMEHHSNLIPWQQLAKKSGAELRVIPINDNGDLILEEGLGLIDKRTTIIALVHTSNSLGTINPINVFIEKARKSKSTILIDAAQAMAHQSIDVQALDCDFLVFSAHKMFGPTGVGVLYGKQELLEEMPPYQYGGEMIESVSLESSTFRLPPHRFEAGTPNIAGVIGLASSIHFLDTWKPDKLGSHSKILAEIAVELLQSIGVRLIGTPVRRAGIVSFLLDDIHPHDVATLLDQEGIAVRAGHHCTEPVMRYYEIPGTLRLSFSAYNTREEVEQVAKALPRIRKILG